MRNRVGNDFWLTFPGNLPEFSGVSTTLYLTGDTATNSKGIQTVFQATLFLAKGIVDTISGIVKVIEGAITGIGQLYQ